MNSIKIYLGLLCVWACLGTSQLQAQPGDTNRYRIRLMQYQFDPLQQMPEIPNRLKMSDTTVQQNYRIIQFAEPLNRQQYQYLKEVVGLKLDQYVKGNAYVERLSPAQLGQLRAQNLLRWEGAYEGAYKLAPNIGQMQYRSPERQQLGGLLLTAILAGDVEIAAFTSFLQGQSATNIEVQDLRKDGFGYRVVFVLADQSKLADIARRPEVYRIFEVPEADLDNGSTAGTIQSGTTGNTPVWNAGIRGEGEIIHVVDSRIDTVHCYFRDVPNVPGVNHRKIVNYRGPDIAIEHGTFVAGIAAGDDINNPNGAGANPGMAFAARLTFTSLDPSTFLADLTAARADGAFIHTNSWHNDDWLTNGTAQYDQTSFDTDNFLWLNEDHLILGSAGNNGEELGAPGTAKNAICVGAAQDDNNEMNFGDGNPAPTPDGRRKPDMFSVGCTVNSARFGTACTVNQLGNCASSWATPALAGAAALVRQYYREGFYPTGARMPSHGFTPSGALLKATLFNSTLDMTGVAGYPSNQEGWGIIRLDDALFFEGDARNSRVWDVRHANGLFTGETHQYEVNIAATGQALKVALAYTDAPGTANSDNNVLTNDLDLVVIAPDGTTTFLGNVFAGGQSGIGGSADNVNNVEIVLRNTPQVGTYTIRVIGTSVNVGQPGQGYALVVSGDFVDPPLPSGEQNTLVVRLFEPGSSAAGLTTVQNRIQAADAYIQEVSYEQTSIDPVYFPSDGSIALDFGYNHYYQANQNPLIELAEEVIGKLVALDPNVFTRGTAATADDIDRLVMVINSASYTTEWATTGPWPYDLPTGLDRPISVSVNSIFNDENLFAHNLCNQLGIWDLHAHPGVVFPSPHADDWDLMAKPLETVGLTVWSKELIDWVSDHGSSISFVPRPAAGATVNQTFGLNYVTDNTANRKAIVVGLTPGANTLANETVYFMIEARDNTGTHIDDLVPESGVLIYRVNENIPQGQGPLRIIDTDLTTPAGDPPLQDAALGAGENITNIEGTGLNVSVANGSAGADFNVTINYDPPETDNDVRITVGNPHWTSPDIWIDSPKDGFDELEGRTPMDRGDDPITGEVNRIYVRIQNPGDGDAFDFDVYVRVSEPYHSVSPGGPANFNVSAGKVHVDLLADGATEVFYVNWTPEDDGDPHSCIEVTIPNVFNDVNPNNNRAQQNTREVESTTASPYTSVQYPFSLTNPKAYAALFYFRPEGIPDDWTYTLSPRKSLLLPGQQVNAILTLQPPIDAPVCTDVDISVTSWEAVGNTLIPAGGASVQVQLRQQTNLDLAVQDTCNYRKRPRNAKLAQAFVSEAAFAQTATTAKVKQRCGIISSGCTNPPMPFTEIILKYITPDGYPFYKTVTTDAFGCYSDFFETVEGGLWEVEATFPGDSCQGSAIAGPVEVNLPQATVRDLDGDGLPDDEEPKDGDSGDGDGNPCLLDPDCDNDGIPDGQEDPDCILNPDCDGNGIPDGQDALKRFGFGLQLGSAHPLGSYSNIRDANVHAQFNLAYRLTDLTEAQLQLGFNQFTTEPPEPSLHTYWFNASVNVSRSFVLPGGWQSYLRGGVGLYRSKAGTNSGGLNLGLGLKVPFGVPAGMTAGFDYHRLFGQDIPAQWISLYLGLMLR